MEEKLTISDLEREVRKIFTGEKTDIYFSVKDMYVDTMQIYVSGVRRMPYDLIHVLEDSVGAVVFRIIPPCIECNLEKRKYKCQ